MNRLLRLIVLIFFLGSANAVIDSVDVGWRRAPRAAAVVAYGSVLRAISTRADREEAGRCVR